jgi:uracil-DNA glycosylase
LTIPVAGEREGNDVEFATMALDLLRLLPGAWRTPLRPYLDRGTIGELSRFVESEYATTTVYPPRGDLFRALRITSPELTRVLILGQDPYHRPGQAHGLSFSVPAGTALPPSLRNIYAELRADLGVAPPPDGDLTRWAEQGVLLLNSVLTVRASDPASHANRGWEHLTDGVIRVLVAKPSRVVFVLWGAYARRKATLIPAGTPHVTIESVHPSPMSFGAFSGTRPFSKVNAALAEIGESPIVWA